MSGNNFIILGIRKELQIIEITSRDSDLSKPLMS
jgi:hypothetical protein